MADSLGDIIDSWLKRSGLDRRVTETSVPDYWTDIVGEAMAGHSSVLRVKDGKMYIKCDSPTWKHEILMRRDTIREKVNERFGTDVVHEIHVL
jgi:predicted nucleic acid-binding Zn ribbon protein